MSERTLVGLEVGAEVGAPTEVALGLPLFGGYLIPLEGQVPFSGASGTAKSVIWMLRHK